MNDINRTREALADWLAYRADWRHGVAERFPDDQRNPEVILELGKLESAVRQWPDDHKTLTEVDRVWKYRDGGITIDSSYGPTDFLLLSDSDAYLTQLASAIESTEDDGLLNAFGIHGQEVRKLVADADDLLAADPDHFEAERGFNQPNRRDVETAEALLGDDAPWHRVAHVAHALAEEEQP